MVGSTLPQVNAMRNSWEVLISEKLFKSSALADRRAAQIAEYLSKHPVERVRWIEAKPVINAFGNTALGRRVKDVVLHEDRRESWRDGRTLTTCYTD
jgi:hypothetical protein